MHTKTRTRTLSQRTAVTTAATTTKSFFRSVTYTPLILFFFVCLFHCPFSLSFCCLFLLMFFFFSSCVVAFREQPPQFLIRIFLLADTGGCFASTLLLWFHCSCLFVLVCIFVLVRMCLLRPKAALAVSLYRGKNFLVLLFSFVSDFCSLVCV